MSVNYGSPVECSCEVDCSSCSMPVMDGDDVYCESCAMPEEDTTKIDALINDIEMEILLTPETESGRKDILIDVLEPILRKHGAGHLAF